MKPENLSDPDMQTATAALVRAAKRARELAQQTGTEYVVVRNGTLVREIPQPSMTKPTKNKHTTSQERDNDTF